MLNFGRVYIYIFYIFFYTTITSSIQPGGVGEPQGIPGTIRFWCGGAKGEGGLGVPEPPKTSRDTVDGSPAFTKQLRLVVYSIIYRVLAPFQVVGLGISEPSTVSRSP